MEAELVFQPKHCIADRESLEPFECSICYELSPETSRCKGPCHQPICLKCVCRIKYMNDRCPNKCSQPLQTEPIPGFTVVYQCPYESQKCKDVSMDVKEFQKHCGQCQFATASALEQLSFKADFKCSKGHQLSLMVPSLLQCYKNSQEFYTAVMNDLCSSCSGRNLCRAICLTCTSQNSRRVYCIECRKYPFAKDQCQFGHSYQKRNIFNKYAWVCDLCGKAGTLVSTHGFFDSQCNVFICAVCYDGLPELNPEENQKKKLM